MRFWVFSGLSHMQIQTTTIPRPISISSNPQNQKFSGTAGQLRFGGVKLEGLNRSMVKNMVSIFQRISEVFVWSFLAQDTIAVWVPRIGISLKVGSKPYDPQQDPENKKLPPGRLMLKTLYKRAKGLNWPNFAEETWREICTGPGMLIVPTLFFMLARNALLLKEALTLSKGDLLAFKEMLKQAMTHSDLATRDAFTEEKMKHAITGVVRDLISDPELKQATHKEIPALKEMGFDHFHDFMQDRAAKWVDQLYREPSRPSFFQSLKRDLKSMSKHYRSPYQGIMDDIDRIVRDYNRDHRPLKIREGMATADSVFNPSGSPEQVKKLFERFQEFHPFLHATRTTIPKYADAPPAIADKIYNRAISRKLWLSLSAMGLNAAFLFMLVKKTQSHNAYPATRLLKEPSKDVVPPVANQDQPNSDASAKLSLQAIPQTPIQNGSPWPAMKVSSPVSLTGPKSNAFRLNSIQPGTFQTGGQI